MKYFILKYNGSFLEVIKDDVYFDELEEFGKIIDNVYTDYGTENQTGYILLKDKIKYYALTRK